MHGGSGTNARPPWTLTATATGLGAYPEHQHPREPHVQRRTRELRASAAIALVQRGIITRAIALVGSTRLDRVLRRLERLGVGVECERGEQVQQYRFRLPASEAA